MKRTTLRHLLCAASTALLLATWAMVPFEAHTETTPCLDGIFLQPSLEHSEWPQQKWQEVFRRMHNLGLRELIVQWCRQDHIKYYPSQGATRDDRTDGGEEPRQEMIPTILRLAKIHDIDVYLGLYHDSAYWSQLEAPPDVVRDYFYSLAHKNLEVAEELLPLVTEFQGFKGFYIPQEVDDVTWTKKGKAQVLNRFIELLTQRLKELHPDSKVLMSSFFRGRTSPRYLAKLWGGFLSSGGLDGLLLQDGFGSGQVTPHLVRRMFTESRKVCDKERVELWSVTEIFEATESTAEKFVARSAPFKRMQEQMGMVGPMVEKRIGFSLKYLMPSSEVAESRKLFTDYKHYVEGRR